MTFENTTAVPVLVFSIDDGGSEAHEGTLEPGEVWSVDTVEGEVWVGQRGQRGTGTNSNRAAVI